MSCTENSRFTRIFIHDAFAGNAACGQSHLSASDNKSMSRWELLNYSKWVEKQNRDNAETREWGNEDGSRQERLHWRRYNHADTVSQGVLTFSTLLRLFHDHRLRKSITYQHWIRDFCGLSLTVCDCQQQKIGCLLKVIVSCRRLNA